MNQAPPFQQSKLRWTSLIAFAFLLIVISAVVLRVYWFKHIPGQANPRTNIGMLRFHNEVYYPVRAFITGENPFNKRQLADFHPDTEYGTAAPLPNMLPSTLLIYCLFGFLKLPYAEGVFLGLSILATVVLSMLLLKKSTQQREQTNGVFFCSALMLVSLPAMETFFTCPATMISLIGVAWTLAYAKQKVWLASIGLNLAMVWPEIGIPVAILVLLRGHLAALAGGLGLMAITNGLAIGYIIHNGGPPLTDVSYWQAFDYTNYTGTVPNVVAGQSPLGLDLASAIQIWALNRLPINLGLLLPAALVLLAGLTLWTERTADQRTGIISRSGMLITTVTVIVFSNSVDALMLLWIPAVGLIVDGSRSKLTFSVGIRFILGLLVVLPLFNYSATPLLMERLKIGPNHFGNPDAETMLSLRTVLADWNIVNPATIEWQIVSTINVCLVVLATLLIAVRIWTSVFFSDRHRQID